MGSNPTARQRFGARKSLSRAYWARRWRFEISRSEGLLSIVAIAITIESFVLAAFVLASALGGSMRTQIVVLQMRAEATGVVINAAEFGSPTYLVLLALGVLGTAAAVGLLVDLAVRPGILAAVAWIVLATGIAVVTGNLDLLAGQLVLGVVLVAAVFKDNANRTRHRAAGRAA